jgi:hypothetical protein
VRPQHARDLEQRGIAGGVVADADIPAVIVAVQQHEALRFDGPRDLHDRDLLGEPALLELGADGRTRALPRERDQLLARRLVDGGDRDPWLARQIVEIGRAPDRGAGAPVDVDAGVDRDQPDRTPLLGEGGQRRVAKTFGQQDLAGELGLGLGDRADRGAEQVAQILGVGAEIGEVSAEIDQRARDAFGNVQRARGWLGAKSLAAGLDRGSVRDAEPELGRVHFDRQAQSPQPLRQVIGGAVDVARPPAWHRREALDQRPGRLGLHVAQESLLAAAHPDLRFRCKMPARRLGVCHRRPACAADKGVESR